MKKLLLLFFLLIFFLKSQAQTSVYHPFPDSNAVWREFAKNWGGNWMCCCAAGVCITHYDYEYFQQGDTLIGSYFYKKIFRTGAGYYYTSGPYTCPPVCTGCDCFSDYMIYSGAIRQDTSAKKVFVVWPGNNSEGILYDFNLNVGDSLNSCGVNYVTLIDSILIENSYRKQFWLSYDTNINNNFVSIIEGIGSTFGLLGQLCAPFESYSKLKCVMIDSSTIYPDTNTVCDIVSEIKQQEKHHPIFISPNPASDKITISNYPFLNKETRVEIYNMRGEKVFSQIISHTGGTEIINVSSFAAGVYLVQVRSEEKVWRGKMIKE